MGQQAADILVRVLSGKKPSVIPVILPKKIDLVVNMKTARAFDIHVPLEALNIATKVIK
jgi:putative ABC transport system substrate-binding protein